MFFFLVVATVSLAFCFISGIIVSVSPPFLTIFNFFLSGLDIFGRFTNLEFAGNLVNVVIPRPNPNGEPSPGVGKVSIKMCIFLLMCIIGVIISL